MRFDPERLVRLYPRAWRDRYGEEFLTTVGSGPLGVQQTIDILCGAVDAWLSSDVRRATRSVGAVGPGGGSLMLERVLVCGRTEARYSTRDALIAAGVMLASTVIFAALGIALRRGGWPLASEMLTGVAFPASLMLSLPFWLMKGQSRKAQVAIVAGTLLLLIAASYVASVWL
jgi:hypothetical protein